MIVYSSKDWFHATFTLHKSDTIRKLFPLLLLMGLYSGGIAYWELEYLKLSERSWVRNITILHNLLGFVMSILLVFRTNTAYDRWWEARKQWGALTNASRNMAIKLNAFLTPQDEASRDFFRKTIAMYAHTLFEHLRSNRTKFMLDEKHHPEFEGLDNRKHGPNQVAALMYSRANRLYKEGLLTGDQLIVVNNELLALTDVCGACERIKNTPIPWSYSSFIKKFIILYVVTLPLGYVFSMGYFVIAAVPFVFYVMASLEIIAESIEDPFGEDPDDLPIDKIAENINKHVAEIIR
ncbi:bestrophin family protein [Parapedobacter koreensis]|uniref:Putative membrane protein n=1 Tax=Parapedobacter koreensis TaxID=332977 RepID=A0A1H7SPD8_9SPHI|nr:bestrophin family protein [Parapedobacter koreensis]SEL74325.1 putative membrane protein [Parapedobacter koreensis]